MRYAERRRSSRWPPQRRCPSTRPDRIARRGQLREQPVPRLGAAWTGIQRAAERIRDLVADGQARARLPGAATSAPRTSRASSVWRARAQSHDVPRLPRAQRPGRATRGERFVLVGRRHVRGLPRPGAALDRSHVEPNATHAENIAHGLYPLSDHVARARLCLSCHFGNADKFVTHRIMGAGHPRMSFELDTFTRSQPAHFQLDADWQQRKGAGTACACWAIGQALAAAELLDSARRSQARPRRASSPSSCCSTATPAITRCRTSAGSPRGAGLGPGVVRLNDSSLLMLRQIAARVDPRSCGALRHACRAAAPRRAGRRRCAVQQARAAQREIESAARRVIGAHRFGAETCARCWTA